MVRYRQHGGNGVGGKYQVRGFNGQQRDEQRCKAQMAFLPDEELIRMFSPGHGRMPGKPIHPKQRMFRPGLKGFSQQVKRGVEQDRAEDVIHPGERIQQTNPCENHGGPHDDGAQHSKEEDSTLLRQLQSEGLKQHEEDKQIVDAQRFFDAISRQVFQGVSLG